MQSCRRLGRCRGGNAPPTEARPPSTGCAESISVRHLVFYRCSTGPRAPHVRGLARRSTGPHAPHYPCTPATDFETTHLVALSALPALHLLQPAPLRKALAPRIHPRNHLRLPSAVASASIVPAPSTAMHATSTPEEALPQQNSDTHSQPQSPPALSRSDPHMRMGVCTHQHVLHGGGC